MTNKILMYILMLITFLSTVAAVYFAFFYENESVLLPDYMPIEQDENVIVMEGEQNASKMDKKENGGSAAIFYDSDIIVYLGTGKIDMSYQNPGRSNAAAVLQLMIDDVVIAQSGSIQPGYKLEDMQLLDGIDLTKGGYHGIIKVGFYDLDTNEKSFVETKLAVEIKVVD